MHGQIMPIPPRHRQTIPTGEIMKRLTLIAAMFTLVSAPALAADDRDVEPGFNATLFSHSFPFLANLLSLSAVNPFLSPSFSSLSFFLPSFPHPSMFSLPPSPPILFHPLLLPILIQSFPLLIPPCSPSSSSSFLPAFLPPPLRLKLPLTVSSRSR